MSNYREILGYGASTFLVLPWHYKDGIVRCERDFLMGGGKLIFPFPEIEIV